MALLDQRTLAALLCAARVLVLMARVVDSTAALNFCLVHMGGTVRRRRGRGLLRLIMPRYSQGKHRVRCYYRDSLLHRSQILVGFLLVLLLLLELQRFVPCSPQTMPGAEYSESTQLVRISLRCTHHFRTQRATLRSTYTLVQCPAYASVPGQYHSVSVSTLVSMQSRRLRATVADRPHRCLLRLLDAADRSGEPEPSAHLPIDAPMDGWGMPYTTLRCTRRVKKQGLGLSNDAHHFWTARPMAMPYINQARGRSPRRRPYRFGRYFLGLGRF